MSDHAAPELLLGDLVRVAQAVADTSKRTEKVALLAELLHGVDPRDAPAVIGLLLGSPQQGRVGVGWATLAAATATAAAANTPDRKSTRLNSSHSTLSRMPSSA